MSDKQSIHLTKTYLKKLEADRHIRVYSWICRFSRSVMGF